MNKIQCICSALNFNLRLMQLNKQNVYISNIERHQNIIHFTANKEWLEIIIQTFKNDNHFSYSLKPTSQALQLIKNRKGLILGFALFVIMLLLSPHLILNYKIEGASEHVQAQIIDTLVNNGYNIFRFKDVSACDKIEQLITSNVKEVKFASCAFSSSTLIVSIIEDDIEEEKALSPIYASSSAVITALNVKSGTPLVKVGDVVKKGQVLVQPYEIINGVNIEVAPSAEIYGREYIKGYVEYNLNSALLGRTGKTYTQTSLNFLSLQVPSKCYGDQNILNGKFEMQTTTQNKCILFVPYQKQITTYYEIGEIGKPDYERDKASLEKQSQYLAYQNLPDDATIINKSTQTVLIDNIYHITTYIEVQANIATKQNPLDIYF